MNKNVVIIVVVVVVPAFIISSYIPYLSNRMDHRVVMLMLLGLILAVPGIPEWLEQQFLPRRKESTSHKEEDHLKWRIIGILLIVGGAVYTFAKYQGYMKYR